MIKAAFARVFLGSLGAARTHPIQLYWPQHTLPFCWIGGHGTLP